MADRPDIRSTLEGALRARDRPGAVEVALGAIDDGSVSIGQLYEVLAAILVDTGDGVADRRARDPPPGDREPFELPGNMKGDRRSAGSRREGLPGTHQGWDDQLMEAGNLVGAALVAGLVLFLVGAGGWRPVYDRPLAQSLPAVHADRRRRAWIHTWMVAALLVTPAGLAGFVVLAEPALARAAGGMGAAIYMVGAVCWVVSLAFRLTVVPWGAERTVADGAPPEQFVAFDAWATALYSIHMLSAYASFVLLGAAVLAGGDLPAWLGWLGVGWGVAFVAGFVVVADRFGAPFYPPFWAHAYTGVLGVVLLAT